METSEAVTLQDVFAARHRIDPHVRRTPLVLSHGLSSRLGANVYLKLETQQTTGSFKIRGAANCLLQLAADQRERGVVTVSTGNHGKAVATMAGRLGIKAVICVPELVLQHKVSAIRELGAQIVVRGKDQDEAEEHAVAYAAQYGMTLVSPFDGPAIIAGQGTIALEILNDLPEVDVVVVPLSGGGLISGIALALKQACRNIRTVGASMERSPVMYWSQQAGRPVQLPEEPTLADSLMGGIGLENRYTFDLVRRYVDDMALLSEREIAASMVYALAKEHVVVEGGGAVGIAAVLFNKLQDLGKNVVVVVSGGNADMSVLRSLLADDNILDAFP